MSNYDKWLHELPEIVAPASDDLLYIEQAKDGSSWKLKWSNLPGGGPVPNLYLDQLLDVTVPTPSSGDVLTWDGVSQWVNLPPSLPTLDQLLDVTVPAPNPGDVLTWDGVSQWVNLPGSSAVTPGLEQINELGQATHKEEITQVVSSDGVTVTYTLDNEAAPGSPVTFYMRDGVKYELLTPDVIVLTPGTDVLPILYYLYVEVVASALVLKSTTDVLMAFGSNSSLLGEVEVQSAVTTQADGGALIFRSMSHHPTAHLAHIDNRIRLGFPPYVFYGLNYINTLTIPTVMDIWVDAGIVWGLHYHEFSIRDTSTGDTILMGNRDFDRIPNVNLVDMPQDTNGGSLQNRYFNIVVYMSFDTQGNERICLNLPNGSYSSLGPAEDDLDATADYSNPFGENLGSILLYQLAMGFNNAGNITLGRITDLRSAQGTTGGGGGTGVYVPATGGRFSGPVEFGDAKGAGNTEEIQIYDLTGNPELRMSSGQNLEADWRIYISGGIETLEFAHMTGGVTPDIKSRFNKDGSFQQFGTIQVHNGSIHRNLGGGISDADVAAGVPTLLPQRTDSDTGISSQASQVMGFVANGSVLATMSGIVGQIETTFIEPINFEGVHGKGVSEIGSGSIDWDARAGNFILATLTADSVLNFPTNMWAQNPNASYLMKVEASGANRTLTFAAGYFTSGFAGAAIPGDLIDVGTSNIYMMFLLGLTEIFIVRSGIGVPT